MGVEFDAGAGACAGAGAGAGAGAAGGPDGPQYLGLYFLLRLGMFAYR